MASDKMLKTPTYYAFEMYKPFMDATFIPVDTGDMAQYTLGEISVPKVSVSAAKSADGDLLLALVNLDPADGVTVSVKLEGLEAESAGGRTLTADAMDAQNTFDEQDTVKPRPIDVQLGDNRVAVDLPAKSVTVVRVR